MLTRSEARKLQDEMRRELEAPEHALWKCAAGLLFVTALVLSGAGAAPSPDAAQVAAQGTHNR
jgi:hypothetical protein